MMAPRVPLVDLKVQHRSIKAELEHALIQVFDRSSFILGAEVEAFEAAFAAYLGVPYAVGVNSGLDALRLALLGVGVEPEDEVILPVNTYIATALAVSAVGARPVLVDVVEESYGIDVEALRRAITSRTKAIIPVHLYGQPCDLDGVLEVAGRSGLSVIEDACQAHGAKWRDGSCGTVGAAGCFSFYPSKNLGAAGDGGMVVTSSPEVAESVRLHRDYGQTKKSHHVVKGFNTRLDEIQAAILRVKLPHLDDWNRSRARHAALYGRLLGGLDGIRTPPSLAAQDHVFHLYVVRVENRSRLMDHLGRRGIQTGIHYPVPIHLQPAYADLGYEKGDFPVAERLACEILSLPMYPELTSGQVELVAEAVREFYQEEWTRGSEGALLNIDER